MQVLMSRGDGRRLYKGASEDDGGRGTLYRGATLCIIGMLPPLTEVVAGMPHKSALTDENSADRC